jgi:VIT1/CCC1 family predicted Fe2+/Mn2+ transporter
MGTMQSDMGPTRSTSTGSTEGTSADDSSDDSPSRDGSSTGPVRPPTKADVRRWQDLLGSEREAAILYDSLADAETGERAEILRELAEVERKHAAHWEGRLVEAGASVPPPGRASLRTRALGTAARRLSLDAVLPMIERAERSDAGMYDADPDAAAGMADDERGHARTLAALRNGGNGDTSALPGAPAKPDSVASQAGPGAPVLDGGRRLDVSSAGGVVGRIDRRETWHRSDRSGALRAAIFGVSDGLVSNTALVMGFAGSGASRSAVLLAGTAGLLAGSFSMAAGEYVSMSGQREMFQREIALEAMELEEKPEEELEELVLLYRAKGLPVDQARLIAERIMTDKEVALDTLAREELGLNPDELGSPWTAAVSSLLAFAVGALVVVLPYLFAGGTRAFVAAVVLAVAAMAGVGAGIGVLNGRSAMRGALRQVTAGVLAAGVTFVVGYLIGTQTG